MVASDFAWLIQAVNDAGVWSPRQVEDLVNNQVDIALCKADHLMASLWAPVWVKSHTTQASSPLTP